MSVKQYHEFKQVLDNAEETIIKNTRIFVTTCKMMNSKRLKDLNITKVVMDEATQSTELEAFLTIYKAHQVVLIGDDK